MFDQCQFKNPDPDPNHGYFLSGPNLTLRNCQLKNYVLITKEKLILKKSHFAGRKLIHGDRGYRAEFILDNSTFENAEEILWDTELKNLTISRCEVKEGAFTTFNSDVQGTTIVEGLEAGAGYFELVRGCPDDKLIVRNCTFSDIDPDVESLFRCSGDVPRETLIERIVGTKDAHINLTGVEDKETAEPLLEVTQNHNFTLRHCKIPHLKLNWLQSHDLLIDHCDIGTLELQDGRLGRVRIKATKFTRILLDRTLADTWEIEPSGEIVPTGSNYPKGKKG